MSAITGIFYRDGRSVNEKQIKKMNNRLSHRGPDGSATWCEGPVALGHQMLHTTPESLHEKLPFEEDGLVITADARIDNRKELSEKLEIEDKEEISDSYFILKAYQKWGEKCPEELLGDFAFAIWDKNEEKMFCARDHMGVKPFYYYLSNELFVFGTEIKALFSNLEIPKNLNELRISDYLISYFEDKEITFYKDIKRLPAANNLRVNFDKSCLSEYWVIDLGKKIILDSDKEYSDKFKDVFTESVGCRLRSAFPIGSMLSGGLDSSSIVCTAKKLLIKDNYTLNTFSAIFDDVPQCDESYYINAVLDGGNIDPNYINADKISPLSNLDKVLWHLDEPLYSPNLFIHWNAYFKAQKRDIRIILDGYDGDSTISHGERVLVELAKNMRWKTLTQEVKTLSENLDISMNHILLYRVIIPLLPLGIKQSLRYMRHLLNASKNNTINGMSLNRDFVCKTNPLERYNSILKHNNTNNSHEYHYKIIRSGIHQFVLEVLDKSAAAFSIEPRYPFFDVRLIEFCLSLPSDQKLFKGWDRIILRRAMKDVLPPEVQWRRRKSNLGYNFDRSFMLYEKDTIKQILLFKNSIVKDYVDIFYLNDIYDLYKEGDAGRDVFSIWKAINLTIWLDKIDLIN